MAGAVDDPRPPDTNAATERVTLRPFRALRYSRTQVPDLAAVTSPPYDVIGEHGVRRYEQASPVNVVRLILPRPSAAPEDGKFRRDRYAQAAHDLRVWLSTGTLVAEAEPSIWVYEQRICDAVWRGLLAAVSVHEPGSPAVVPHEDVSWGPVRDRAALMEATSTQPEPIMLVHSGAESLGRALRRLPVVAPDIDVTTEDAVKHVLWRISDSEHIAELDRVAGTGSALIADGHHRYAAYQQQKHRHASDRSDGWRFGFAWLVDAATDPLSLSAIHRILHGVSLDALVAAVSPYVRCTPVSGSVDDWLTQLKEVREPAVVVTDGHRAARVDLIPSGQPSAGESEYHDALRRVDTVILHDALFPAALGIRGDDPRIDYAHNAVEAVDWARSTRGVAVLMRPPALEDVLAAATAGVRMPRKTTSFGPKPRNGLILRSVGDPR